jgi:hypothetical protein
MGFGPVSGSRLHNCEKPSQEVEESMIAKTAKKHDSP